MPRLTGNTVPRAAAKDTLGETATYRPIAGDWHRLAFPRIATFVPVADDEDYDIPGSVAFWDWRGTYV